MRIKTRTPVVAPSEPTLETQGEVDVVSLMTTTVALFGLMLVSVLSLLNIITG